MTVPLAGIRPWRECHDHSYSTSSCTDFRVWSGWYWSVHTPPEPALARLAEAFQAQRERSGMTFDELAAASGLARQTLLNLSAGRVHGDLRTWVILAKVWDVSLDELVAPIWR